MKLNVMRRVLLSITAAAILTLTASSAFAVDPRNVVIAPYWQAAGSDYTFIAVSHPSLTGIASQIGVRVTALDLSAASFATAVSFTVDAGSTQRLFILQTGASISTVATSAPTTAHNMIGSSGTGGNLRITPVATAPLTTQSANVGAGKRDITQLSFWGAIVISSVNGFAVEFIGDTHDSTTRGVQTSHTAN